MEMKMLYVENIIFGSNLCACVCVWVPVSVYNTLFHLFFFSLISLRLTFVFFALCCFAGPHVCCYCCTRFFCRRNEFDLFI